MSSAAVRQAFEGSWPTLMPGLPLYGTINEEPDRVSLPPQWASVDYLADRDERISLGDRACWRETGVIAVTILVGSGQGDAGSIALIDQVRNAYRDWVDGKVWVHRADPPESGATSDGRWYLSTTSLYYQYDRFV